MTLECQRCGCAVRLTDESGATDTGPFREDYECVNCSAKGWISGDAGHPPHKWNRYGTVFA